MDFVLDLNNPPPITDDNLEDEHEPTISVTHSSSGNFIIDLNENDNEIGYRFIELDLNEIPDATNEALLDSSDEEVEVEQLVVNTATTTRANANMQTNTGRKRKVLTDPERTAVYHALLEKSNDGILKTTTTTEVQAMFNVKTLRTVQRIWKIHKDTQPGATVDVKSKKKGNCGRKRVEVDLNLIKTIPLHKRTTLTSLAAALGIGYTKLHRLFKQGVLRRHSSAIKPYLKDDNKIARLLFCLSMLDDSATNDPKFKDMFNYVHIDEKWFYLTKKDQTFYLICEEELPDRSCQSKNFIAKVMFLVAVARPIFDDDGTLLFDGKIGCWPFVIEEPAKRDSKNRRAGTMEMKAITSIKRDTNKEFLLEKVIPAIREKWPISERGKPIFIQQDNCRTHVAPTDPDVLAAGSQDGFDIRLTCQPPNSPDFNILDLGFFRAIQSLQQKIRAKNTRDLVDAVKQAFNEYSPVKLNYVWLTLQLCMKEAMKLGGGNRYKIPHINKQRLQRLGCLPTQIACEIALVQATRDLVAPGAGTRSATNDDA